MRISYLSVGDELLDGRVTDSNLTFTGGAIRRAGLRIHTALSVPDVVSGIAAAVAALSLSSDIVVVSGGCGPTTDDVTREAIALAAGVPLVRNAEAEQRVREKFASRGITMTDNNLRQADMPEGCALLPSEVGTADVCMTRVTGAEVYSLPGVPREFESLFRRWVEPRIQAQEPLRTLRLTTFGIGESMLGARVEALAPPESVRIAYCAAWPTVQLELTAAPDASDALNHLYDKLLLRLSPWTFEASSPAHELAQLLVAQQLRMVTAESCTGGLVASSLTDVPGASAWFDSAWVTYANRAKIESLDVPPELIESHGAVSAEVVEAMARNARRRSGADLAISVSGIAGPSGGTADKPVGTVWLALTTEASTLIIGARAPARSRTAFKQFVAALAQLAACRVLQGRTDEIDHWWGVQSVRVLT
jgi:nicotinamide-nucleotide amidase